MRLRPESEQSVSPGRPHRVMSPKSPPLCRLGPRVRGSSREASGARGIGGCPIAAGPCQPGRDAGDDRRCRDRLGRVHDGPGGEDEVGRPAGRWRRERRGWTGGGAHAWRVGLRWGGIGWRGVPGRSGEQDPSVRFLRHFALAQDALGDDRQPTWPDGGGRLIAASHSPSASGHELAPSEGLDACIEAVDAVTEAARALPGTARRGWCDGYQRDPTIVGRPVARASPLKASARIHPPGSGDR